MVLFIDTESGFPVASLLSCPIIVARPISWIARDDGPPVLDLSSCSSFENERLSGPESSIRSLTTKPHTPQNLSPVEPSVTMALFPQRAHFMYASESRESISLSHTVCLSSNKNGGIEHFIFIWYYTLKTAKATAKIQFVILAITSDGCSTVRPLLTKNLEMFVISL